MKASKILGKNIRLLRKAKKLTLNEFATKINKSVSTMSKYENGDISMDIDTLCEIAEMLEVNLEVLLDNIMENKFKNKEAINVALLNNNDKFYMYHLNAKNNRIIKSIMTKSYSEKENKFTCKLYLDLQNLDDLLSCNYYYYGNFCPFDSVTNIYLENFSNKMEKLSISINNPFSNTDMTNGLLLGIVGKSLSPGVVKILLSSKIIEDDEILFDQLKFCKDEIKEIRKLNYLSLQRDQKIL